MLPPSFDRIDANVHQQFRAVNQVMPTAWCPLKVEWISPSAECHQFTIGGLNGNAVALRTAGKGFVLHLGQRHYSAVQAGRQHGILLLPGLRTVAGEGCGCRILGAFSR